MSSDKGRVAASGIVGACALGLAAALLIGQPRAQPVRPVVVPPVVRPVVPAPKCPDCDPKKPRRPWRELWSGRSAGTGDSCCGCNPCLCGPACPCLPSCCAGVGAEEPAVDLLSVPGRKANIASKGLGCCVFRSLEYAARWQNEPALHGFPEWMVQQGVPGGGYPTKVDQLIPRISQSRSMPTPRYLQYQGKDPSIIELALKTGRLPCITWGGNHMLNCVHLDAQRAGIVDNNAPERVQWYSRTDFIRKWTQGGGAWVAVLLNPGPPPPPAGNRPQPVQAITARRPTGLEVASEAIFGVIRPRADAGPAAALSDWNKQGWSEEEYYEISGVAVSGAMVAAALADDSQLPHLTVIGPDAERQQVLADLAQHPALAQWRDRVLVQSYAPGDWACQFGFVTSGRPTIYLQARDGRVLMRSDSYGGPESLAAKLRRADPSYDPKQDPGGEAAAPSLSGIKGWVADHALLLVGIGGAAVAVVLLLRSGSPAAAAPGQQAAQTSPPVSPVTPAVPQPLAAPRDRLRELADQLLEKKLAEIFAEPKK